MENTTSPGLNLSMKVSTAYFNLLLQVNINRMHPDDTL